MRVGLASGETAGLREELLQVIAARRQQFWFRVGMCLGIGSAFAPLVGVGAGLAWMAAYGALQVFERYGLARPTVPTMLLVLHLNSWIFGLFGVWGPFNDGAWGLAAGSSLMAGALLHSALSNQRSAAAFAATITPFAIYLLAMPGLALLVGAEVRHAVILGLSGALIVGATVAIWRRSVRALTAEQEARRHAEQAHAAKSAYVAAVSHELRTPISAILAGARAGEAAGRSGENQLILDAARMMRALLDDLLDHAKLEAGRMSVEAIAFDLRRLLKDTAAFWRPEARARGVRLRMTGARSLPQWICGDPIRLRQVLNNLISNAMKFTEAGSVTLELSRAEAPGGASLTVTVADTGAGMSPEQLARLFQPFGQGDASIARTYGGTGLGLAISRDLVRLMGGELSVTSAEGKGSRFSFSIPHRPAEPAAEPAQAAPAAAAAGLRILVADDHEVNRRALSLMLAPIAEAVVCTSDGAEALEAAGREAFDLVLLDLHMPRMDGLEAARRLRAAFGPELKIVALTGATSPEDIAACRAAGMDGFVAKPIEVEALLGAIGAAFGHAEAAAA